MDKLLTALGLMSGTSLDGIDASILVSNAVLSTFLPFIELPEFISIETKASVGLITKYPPDLSFISESNM